MRTIITIVLGIFIAQTLTAQTDTLVIKLDDYGQMIVVSTNLVGKKQKIDGIDVLYKQFYSDFSKIDPSVFKDKKYLISFKAATDNQKASQISIKDSENEGDKYFFQDGKQQSISAYKYELSLNSEGSIKIYLDSLNDLKRVNSISLDSLYEQSFNYMKTSQLRNRTHYKIFYSSKSGKVDENSAFIHEEKSFDYINLFPSFGMRMIQSTFAPEASINVDFILGKKGGLDQRFGISTSFLFMPDKNDFFDVKTYNFLNASYYLKYNSKWSQKISVGYMISGDGEDFNGKTWSASWQPNIGSIGMSFGGFYTKNTTGKYVFLPSIGISFGF